MSDISPAAEWTGIVGLALTVIAALVGKEPVARWWAKRHEAATKAEEVRMVREDAYILHLRTTVDELTGSMRRQLEEAWQRETGLIEDRAKARAENEALKIELAEVKQDRDRLIERLAALGAHQ